jgi:hypothetical protein
LPPHALDGLLEQTASVVRGHYDGDTWHGRHELETLRAKDAGFPERSPPTTSDNKGWGIDDKAV